MVDDEQARIDVATKRTAEFMKHSRTQPGAGASSSADLNIPAKGSFIDALQKGRGVVKVDQKAPPLAEDTS